MLKKLSARFYSRRPHLAHFAFFGLSSYGEKGDFKKYANALDGHREVTERSSKMNDKKIKTYIRIEP